MKINLSRTFVFAAAAALLAVNLALVPAASAATNAAGSAGSNDYVEIPLSYSRTKPKMKSVPPSNCRGQGGPNDCLDVESGVGMYNYVGSAPAPTRANISSVTVVTMEGSPTNHPTDTSPPFEVVNGNLRIYGLVKGKQYKISYSYDDAKSTDIQNIIKNEPKYCTGDGKGTILGSHPELNMNGPEFKISQHLANGCSRYNTAAFLPQQVLGSSVNGGEAFTYKGGAVTLSSTPMAAANANAQSASSAQSDTGDECPLAADAPLRWLGCPLIAIGASTVQALQSKIEEFLYTPVEQIFNNAGFKSTSNVFRNLGIGLVIAAGLVMIISQALGMEIVDAYTVRKLLPRLAIVLIGMVMVWPLLRFVVTFFNDIGLWSSSLIGQIADSGISTQGQDAGIGGGVLALAFGGTAATAAVVALGLGGILSLLGTILLALLIGFIVLAIRQMVILVAILLAPLAIAAYVLPGTQKLWHFWRQALFTALLMFPIIMLFLASGKALSTILSAAGKSTGDGTMTLLAVFVYFAPFFLLPFAFKMAGGLMSTIFSIANDKSRGLFDRGKKYRQGQMAKNTAAMKAGNRFSDRNKVSRAFNRTSVGVGTGWKGRYGLGKRGAQAVDQVHRGAAMGTVMKSPEWATISEDDDALRAATYDNASDAIKGIRQRYLDQGKDEKTAQANAERAVAAAQASIGFGRPQAIAAAQQLATTGTGYVDMEDQARTIARAARGDKNTAASIAGYNNFINKQKGRYDLSPGAGKLIDLAHQEIDGGDGRPKAAAYHDATIAGAQTADSVTLLRGKKPQVENLVKALRYAHENPRSGGTPEDLEFNQQVVTQISQLRGSLNYASPEVQAVVERHLGNLGIDPSYQGQAQQPGMPGAQPQPPSPPPSGGTSP